MIDLLREAVASLLIFAGSALMLLAAVGAVRLPDLFTRMHATTKAGALGVALIMAGVAVYFADAGITARAVAIIAFVFLTAPVAAHIIGRAGYFVGVPMWSGTIKDELQGRYDADTHRLEGTAAEKRPEGRP